MILMIDSYEWEKGGWIKCILMNCEHLRHEYIRGRIELWCTSEEDICAGCSKEPFIQGREANNGMFNPREARERNQIMNEWKSEIK
jgi:hypothetical protein